MLCGLFPVSEEPAGNRLLPDPGQEGCGILPQFLPKQQQHCIIPEKGELQSLRWAGAGAGESGLAGCEWPVYLFPLSATWTPPSLCAVVPLESHQTAHVESSGDFCSHPASSVESHLLVPVARGGVMEKVLRGLYYAGERRLVKS